MTQTETRLCFVLLLRDHIIIRSMDAAEMTNEWALVVLLRTVWRGDESMTRQFNIVTNDD